MKTLNKPVLIQTLKQDCEFRVIVYTDKTAISTQDSGFTWNEVSQDKVEELLSKWDHYIDPTEVKINCELPELKVA